MMLTFETEAIYYCFLNIWLTLGWTKKNKKKKPNCGYWEIWICQAEWLELVIQSWKHSYVGLAYRLVVGINIA